MSCLRSSTTNKNLASFSLYDLDLSDEHLNNDHEGRKCLLPTCQTSGHLSEALLLI